MTNNNQGKPNQEKHRIWAGVIIILLIFISVPAVAIYSSSLSAEIILALFGLSYIIVLAIFFLTIMRPRSAQDRKLTMNNPIVALAVAIIASVIAFFIFRAIGNLFG